MRRSRGSRLRPHLTAVRESLDRSRIGIQTGDLRQVVRALSRAIDHLDAADRLRAAEARLAERVLSA